MKCINVKENLDVLLDGEIEISQAEKIENHLENCAFCRKEFRNLQAISRALKQNSAVSAPAFLDAKIFSEFESFHAAKPTEKLSKEKVGWFGIPRFAFAAALVLFVLATISAFQIGRMSASEISVVIPEVKENTLLKQDEKAESVKIVEVPVVREKIVEVPVIKEKIVTRIIYKNINPEDAKKNDKKNVFPQFDKAENSTVSSRLKDNRYSTQINLKGFQPVSELNFQVIKGEQNEK